MPDGSAIERSASAQLDLAVDSGQARPGVRLHAVEIVNWGTFDKQIWRLDLGGDNALLTGDIGSGKSTLVDAITSLLVPAQKIAFNKAAGAEARERDLRSYVLGHYKSERGEAGLSAKPVALRDHNSYSVILARFRNEGYGETVTLAQVFWFKETHGQPSRFYLVADRALSIAEHFSSFGRDINALRKRLRRLPHVELLDHFPPYGAAFRRRFGIDSEQALDLFHQTVSMKAVGDLTDFVRTHMLEPFPVEDRIGHMIAHFEDLTRAHEAVVKARAQIERLTPIVADCDAHAALITQVEDLRISRDTLRAFFAGHKIALLDKRISGFAADIARLDERIAALREKRRGQDTERDALKQAILENGGDRIAALGREIDAKAATRQERKQRAESYGRIAGRLGLAEPRDADGFLANRGAITAEIETASAREADIQNKAVETQIEFRSLREQHAGLSGEIASLKSRRSNVPARMLAIRSELCAALELVADELPFAGELIEVRQEERSWEGAAERLLHGFALSLLVPDKHYAAVAGWVDTAHLGQRLVYYRVQSRSGTVRARRDQRAMTNKLAIKDDSPFYDWLQRELDERFDHICCSSLDEFRREEKAVTRAGQMKSGGKRHEKDDRTRIDDRANYVLGWSNAAKIAALEQAAAGLEERVQALGTEIARLGKERDALRDRLGKLQQLSAYASFSDLDWGTIALEIKRLEEERRQLEEGSDKLKTLKAQLDGVERAIDEDQKRLDDAKDKHSRLDASRMFAEQQKSAAVADVATATKELCTQCFPKLEALRPEALGEHRLTVESCDGHERKMRDWLQGRIDAVGKRLTGLRDRIVAAMSDYANRWPEETREVDASVEAAGEYRQMLAALESDGLPRFEARFKALLNENTIREVAGFQSQLRREAEEIRERIAIINRSLREIDYERGRYILLEAEPTTDAEVRQFQQDLRACTEGSLTGSEDQAYSEIKFEEVKRIIERFRGRDGTSELDKRWTRKVTDVRSWFVFSASERWRSDDSEHEHYSDSGGKSGGQKEKLAYTILAASLAYQFGLDTGAARSRAFHFVVIDEAFGRGSDESARFGLDLFKQMGLQLLIVTPLQKIHIIEPYVAAVGFVHNEDGRRSRLRNLTIEEYRAERLRRAG
ncbi:MAG: hypothetical protein KJZ80_03620 [Hyphomicrobiaceae bacterium]|nr:hypothetical protein [Hyphomicrobiaceae bacterium]